MMAAESKREHEVTKRYSRVFQEVSELEAILNTAGKLIKPGGRLAIMSCHSLEDCRVKHAQRSLDLNREVHVAWRVDDVDFSVLPLAKGGGRLNSDALFTFQIHAVHFCANAIFASHLMDFVDAPRVVKDALSQGRLSRVDVRGNTDVAHRFEVRLVTRICARDTECAA